MADAPQRCPHLRTGIRLPVRPRIVSVSKRTDVPAFFLRWFLGRVERGWVDVPNPSFARALRAAGAPAPNGARARRELDAYLERTPRPEQDRRLANFLTHVSLQPSDVLGIVWWSKNFAPLLRMREAFRRFPRQQFQFTVTPKRADLVWLEPGLPAEEEAAAQLAGLRAEAELLARLAERSGLAPIPPSEAVVWRYDPLVFWWEDGLPRSTWDEEFFVRMCRRMRELGLRRCVTSVADRYAKVERRWRECAPGRPLRDPEPEELAGIAERMRAIAGEFGLRLEACAEASFERLGVPPARCIDAELFPPAAGRASRAAASDRAFATRRACGCHEHTDVGDYEWQRCGYGCLYCYANPTLRAAPAGATSSLPPRRRRCSP